MLRTTNIYSQKKHSVLSSKLLCRTILFLLTIFTFVLNGTEAKANEKYAAFVMDVDSGLILHRRHENKILYPASLTKMMTLLLTFEALDRGDIKLYSRVRISKHAASMIPSKLGLKPGSTIKVKDAIHALSTKSANDVAVALAEKLGGTESQFAVMMTKKARELGMTKTRFRNASGLHDKRQVSTARDMAKLSRELVTTYKHHYHYFSRKKFTYQGKTYRSHNKLMDTYEGMDGLKTGYIRQSGFNLAASAVRNDRRLIGVVFGGKTGKSRNAQMKKLLDRAFKKIGTLQIAKSTIPIPQRKPINASLEIASIKPQKRQPFNAIEPAAQLSRWSMLDTTSEGSVFNRMIGEGDYDISVRNRIETGLIAISAHKGETIPDYIFNNAEIQPIPMNKIPPRPSKISGDWAIQIGAFTSRERTDKAIITSLNRLPSYLQHGRSTIAPLQTEQGWIFRGRLHGYTKDSARDACNLLSDCITIPPQ